MRTVSMVVTIILTLGLVVSAQQEGTREADVEAMHQAREHEVAALFRGDLDSLALAFTADCAVMPPGMPLIRGLDALRSWAEGLAGLEEPQSVVFTDSEVTLAGDWAIERYSVTATRTDGDQVVSKGIHIYARQPDGTWRIAQDVWNPSP